MIRPEHLTITLPADVAALVQRAVDAGLYASAREVVEEALRDWQRKTERGGDRLETLRRDIDAGLEDLAAGRIVVADIDDIMARGGRRSAIGDPSA